MPHKIEEYLWHGKFHGNYVRVETYPTPNLILIIQVINIDVIIWNLHFI